MICYLKQFGVCEAAMGNSYQKLGTKIVN